MTWRCKLTVHAGAHRRRNCPVTVFVPWSYKDVRSVRLSEAGTRRVLLTQISRAKGGIDVHFLLDHLPAGATLRFRMQGLSRKILTDDAVSVQDDPAEGRTDFAVGGKLFTSYHYGSRWSRPFLFPVNAGPKTSVTRSWPMDATVPGEVQDQPHQRSLWVGYGDCSGVDNWTDLPGHGYQKHQAFRSRTSGPIFGQISAKIAWCNHRHRKQFDETRDIRVYATRGGARIMDITVSFAMNTAPVTFRDTKEGGLLALRVATSMDVRNGGRIETAHGAIDQAEAWGRSAPWCDYSGEVRGKRVGIAVMEHDENPRFPTGWHVRDYGLMAANCFAWSNYRPQAGLRGDMTFRKGSRTTWRYRVYVHRGDARQGNVAERYCDYAFPPRVAIDE